MSLAPKEVYPQTFQSFDIISNLPLGRSFTARPLNSSLTARPPVRTIPAFLQRDFDILTNRKFVHGPAHSVDESEICRRDAAWKLRRNFHPILQKFSDSGEDARLAEFQAAQLADEVVRKQISVPPSLRFRPTAFHDLVSNEPASESARKFLEEISVHKFPYPMRRLEKEAELAERDERTDAEEENRKLQKINFQRFAEQLNRGFDILTNADHAFNSLPGSHFRSPWMPRVKPPISPAERLKLNSARSSTTGILTKRTARTMAVPRLNM